MKCKETGHITYITGEESHYFVAGMQTLKNWSTK